MKMIAIVDYDMGNLRSVEKAFLLKGFEAKVTDNPDILAAADGMVIPGVGAFPDAMKNLRSKGLIDLICRHAASGKPLLGICLGMQVLFEEGFEGDRCKGLGLMSGQIVRIPEGVKIPHMGWNRLKMLQESPILKGTEAGAYVYFVHSYYAANCPPYQVAASTEYGIAIPAVVQKDNIYGLQFHPEKSSDAGLAMIKNFGELSQC